MEVVLGVPLALGGGHGVATVTWHWWHRELGVPGEPGLVLWSIANFWGGLFPISGMVSTFWDRLSPLFGMISPHFQGWFILPFWGSFSPLSGIVSPHFLGWFPLFWDGFHLLG